MPYSFATALAFPLHNPYIRYISAYSLNVKAIMSEENNNKNAKNTEPQELIKRTQKLQKRQRVY